MQTPCPSSPLFLEWPRFDLEAPRGPGLFDEVGGDRGDPGRIDIKVVGAIGKPRARNRHADDPLHDEQRGLAQSMARNLGPAGIHVALIIVDGVIGGPVTRSRFPDRPDDFFIDPAGIAATAASLVKQDRSAWSFEVETRPFKEKW